MQGKLIIISAPSGAGKTTIVHYLLSKIPSLEFSVSACSRAKRANEVYGRDYYFLTPEEFKKKIDNEEFVEWEEVYTGNFYGTLKSEIERIRRKGHHVIFDVDVVGGLNLKRKFGKDALGIFIMPPSVKHLEERLKQRETETEETISRRISKAVKELTTANDFDHVVVNDNLESAKKEAEDLVKKFLSQK